MQQKLRTDEYEEIEQLTEDVQLLIDNAKAYYQVWKLKSYDFLYIRSAACLLIKLNKVNLNFIVFIYALIIVY